MRAVHDIHYSPPELIEELSVDRVASYREGIRHLFFEEDWTRHFGDELKRTVDGPLWRYDPDAQEASTTEEPTTEEPTTEESKPGTT